ncbi:MAG: RdgB/HAM1 family non-canonical purine NTP pyrophosphatase [Pseudomonadota bacterium]
MTKIVLASGNPGKAKEIQETLDGAIEIVIQKSLNIDSVPETGTTFVENALIKAHHACHSSGLASLADDSGIEVYALKGKPGIYSARYAGPQATDEDNINKLLEVMGGLEDRRCRFFCCMVFMKYPGDPTPVICQGSWEGSVFEQPRGANGFGYDPVFLAKGHTQSAAEMESRLKNAISHRGQALKKMVPHLQGWLEQWNLN